MLVNEKGVRFQEKGFHGDNSFFLSPKKRAEITKKDDIFGALFTLCIQYEYTVYCILKLSVNRAQDMSSKMTHLYST